ncbi:origin recognition complex subunit, putative [Babesia caballi]|uniref:Origin recognition complex subunit, putative n=1 Tax=Babesia caballi TaxID=5871 RepID=A0AAV4M328_BABCB|nr:origin recognition complex subunit, putative [Babesia caballi]
MLLADGRAGAFPAALSFSARSPRREGAGSVLERYSGALEMLRNQLWSSPATGNVTFEESEPGEDGPAGHLESREPDASQLLPVERDLCAHSAVFLRRLLLRSQEVPASVLDGVLSDERVTDRLRRLNDAFTFGKRLYLPEDELEESVLRAVTTAAAAFNGSCVPAVMWPCTDPKVDHNERVRVTDSAVFEALQIYRLRKHNREVYVEWGRSAPASQAEAGALAVDVTDPVVVREMSDTIFDEVTSTLWCLGYLALHVHSMSSDILRSHAAAILADPGELTAKLWKYYLACSDHLRTRCKHLKDIDKTLADKLGGRLVVETHRVVMLQVAIVKALLDIHVGTRSMSVEEYQRYAAHLESRHFMGAYSVARTVIGVEECASSPLLTQAVLELQALGTMLLSSFFLYEKFGTAGGFGVRDSFLKEATKSMRACLGNLDNDFYVAVPLLVFAYACFLDNLTKNNVVCDIDKQFVTDAGRYLERYAECVEWFAFSRDMFITSEAAGGVTTFTCRMLMVESFSQAVGTFGIENVPRLDAVVGALSRVVEGDDVTLDRGYHAAKAALLDRVSRYLMSQFPFGLNSLFQLLASFLPGCAEPPSDAAMDVDNDCASMELIVRYLLTPFETITVSPMSAPMEYKSDTCDFELTSDLYVGVQLLHMLGFEKRTLVDNWFGWEMGRCLYVLRAGSTGQKVAVNSVRHLASSAQFDPDSARDQLWVVDAGLGRLEPNSGGEFWMQETYMQKPSETRSDLLGCRFELGSAMTVAHHAATGHKPAQEELALQFTLLRALWMRPAGSRAKDVRGVQRAARGARRQVPAGGVADRGPRHVDGAHAGGQEPVPLRALEHRFPLLAALPALPEEAAAARGAAGCGGGAAELSGPGIRGAGGRQRDGGGVQPLLGVFAVAGVLRAPPGGRKRPVGICAAGPRDAGGGTRHPHVPGHARRLAALRGAAGAVPAGAVDAERVAPRDAEHVAHLAGDGVEPRHARAGAVVPGDAEGLRAAAVRAAGLRAQGSERGPRRVPVRGRGGAAGDAAARRDGRAAGVPHLPRLQLRQREGHAGRPRGGGGRLGAGAARAGQPAASHPVRVQLHHGGGRHVDAPAGHCALRPGAAGRVAGDGERAVLRGGESGLLHGPEHLLPADGSADGVGLSAGGVFLAARDECDAPLAQPAGGGQPCGPVAAHYLHELGAAARPVRDGSAAEPQPALQHARRDAAVALLRQVPGGGGAAGAVREALGPPGGAQGPRGLLRAEAAGDALRQPAAGLGASVAGGAHVQRGRRGGGDRRRVALHLAARAGGAAAPAARRAGGGVHAGDQQPAAAAAAGPQPVPLRRDCADQQGRGVLLRAPDLRVHGRPREQLRDARVDFAVLFNCVEHVQRDGDAAAQQRARRGRDAGVRGRRAALPRAARPGAQPGRRDAGAVRAAGVCAAGGAVEGGARRLLLEDGAAGAARAGRPLAWLRLQPLRRRGCDLQPAGRRPAEHDGEGAVAGACGGGPVRRHGRLAAGAAAGVAADNGMFARRVGRLRPAAALRQGGPPRRPRRLFAAAGVPLHELGLHGHALPHCGVRLGVRGHVREERRDGGQDAAVLPAGSVAGRRLFGAPVAVPALPARREDAAAPLAAAGRLLLRGAGVRHRSGKRSGVGARGGQSDVGVDAYAALLGDLVGPPEANGFDSAGPRPDEAASADVVTPDYSFYSFGTAHEYGHHYLMDVEKFHYFGVVLLTSANEDMNVLLSREMAGVRRCIELVPYVDSLNDLKVRLLRQLCDLVADFRSVGGDLDSRMQRLLGDAVKADKGAARGFDCEMKPFEMFAFNGTMLLQLVLTRPDCLAEHPVYVGLLIELFGLLLEEGMSLPRLESSFIKYYQCCRPSGVDNASGIVNCIVSSDPVAGGGGTAAEQPCDSAVVGQEFRLFAVNVFGGLVAQVARCISEFSERFHSVLDVNFKSPPSCRRSLKVRVEALESCLRYNGRLSMDSSMSAATERALLSLGDAAGLDRPDCVCYDASGKGLEVGVISVWLHFTMCAFFGRLYRLLYFAAKSGHELEPRGAEEPVLDVYQRVTKYAAKSLARSCAALVELLHRENDRLLQCFADAGSGLLREGELEAAHVFVMGPYAAALALEAVVSTEFNAGFLQGKGYLHLLELAAALTALPYTTSACISRESVGDVVTGAALMKRDKVYMAECLRRAPAGAAFSYANRNWLRAMLFRIFERLNAMMMSGVSCKAFVTRFAGSQLFQRLYLYSFLCYFVQPLKYVSPKNMLAKFSDHVLDGARGDCVERPRGRHGGRGGPGRRPGGAADGAGGAPPAAAADQARHVRRGPEPGPPGGVPPGVRLDAAPAELAAAFGGGRGACAGAPAVRRAVLHDADAGLPERSGQVGGPDSGEECFGVAGIVGVAWILRAAREGGRGVGRAEAAGEGAAVVPAAVPLPGAEERGVLRRVPPQLGDNDGQRLRRSAGAGQLLEDGRPGPGEAHARRGARRVPGAAARRRGREREVAGGGAPVPGVAARDDLRDDDGGLRQLRGPVRVGPAPVQGAAEPQQGPVLFRGQARAPAGGAAAAQPPHRRPRGARDGGGGGLQVRALRRGGGLAAGARRRGAGHGDGAPVPAAAGVRDRADGAVFGAGGEHGVLAEPAVPARVLARRPGYSRGAEPLDERSRVRSGSGLVPREGDLLPLDGDAAAQRALRSGGQRRAALRADRQVLRHDGAAGRAPRRAVARDGGGVRGELHLRGAPASSAAGFPEESALLRLLDDVGPSRRAHKTAVHRPGARDPAGRTDGARPAEEPGGAAEAAQRALRGAGRGALRRVPQRQPQRADLLAVEAVPAGAGERHLRGLPAGGAAPQAVEAARGAQLPGAGADSAHAIGDGEEPEAGRGAAVPGAAGAGLPRAAVPRADAAGHAAAPAREAGTHDRAGKALSEKNRRNADGTLPRPAGGGQGRPRHPAGAAAGAGRGDARGGHEGGERRVRCKNGARGAARLRRGQGDAAVGGVRAAPGRGGVPVVQDGRAVDGVLLQAAVAQVPRAAQGGSAAVRGGAGGAPAAPVQGRGRARAERDCELPQPLRERPARHQHGRERHRAQAAAQVPRQPPGQVPAAGRLHLDDGQPCAAAEPRAAAEGPAEGRGDGAAAAPAEVRHVGLDRQHRVGARHERVAADQTGRRLLRAGALAVVSDDVVADAVGDIGRLREAAEPPWPHRAPPTRSCNNYAPGFVSSAAGAARPGPAAAPAVFDAGVRHLQEDQGQQRRRGRGRAVAGRRRAEAVGPGTGTLAGLKLRPQVVRLVDEILNLTLIESADLCDLCQERLAGSAHEAAIVRRRGDDAGGDAHGRHAAARGGARGAGGAGRRGGSGAGGIAAAAASQEEHGDGDAGGLRRRQEDRNHQGRAHSDRAGPAGVEGAGGEPAAADQEGRGAGGRAEAGGRDRGRGRHSKDRLNYCVSGRAGAGGFAAVADVRARRLVVAERGLGRRVVGAVGVHPRAAPGVVVVPAVPECSELAAVVGVASHGRVAVGVVRPEGRALAASGLAASQGVHAVAEGLLGPRRVEVRGGGVGVAQGDIRRLLPRGWRGFAGPPGRIGRCGGGLERGVPLALGDLQRAPRIQLHGLESVRGRQVAPGFRRPRRADDRGAARDGFEVGRLDRGVGACGRAPLRLWLNRLGADWGGRWQVVLAGGPGEGVAVVAEEVHHVLVVEGVACAERVAVLELPVAGRGSRLTDGGDGSGWRGNRNNWVNFFFKRCFRALRGRMRRLLVRCGCHGSGGLRKHERGNLDRLDLLVQLRVSRIPHGVGRKVFLVADVLVAELGENGVHVRQVDRRLAGSRAPGAEVKHARVRQLQGDAPAKVLEVLQSRAAVDAHQRDDQLQRHRAGAPGVLSQTLHVLKHAIVVVGPERDELQHGVDDQLVAFLAVVEVSVEQVVEVALQGPHVVAGGEVLRRLSSAAGQGRGRRIWCGRYRLVRAHGGGAREVARAGLELRVVVRIVLPVLGGKPDAGYQRRHNLVDGVEHVPDCVDVGVGARVAVVLALLGGSLVGAGVASSRGRALLEAPRPPSLVCLGQLVQVAETPVDEACAGVDAAHERGSPARPVRGALGLLLEGVRRVIYVLLDVAGVRILARGAVGLEGTGKLGVGVLPRRWAGRLGFDADPRNRRAVHAASGIAL